MNITPVDVSITEETMRTLQNNWSGKPVLQKRRTIEGSIEVLRSIDKNEGLMLAFRESMAIPKLELAWGGMLITLENVRVGGRTPTDETEIFHVKAESMEVKQ